MTATEIRRDVQLVRHTGDSAPCRHRWGCRIDSTPDGLDVHIAAPENPEDIDLEEPASRLHGVLLGQIPRVLRTITRSEVGIVRTEIRQPGRAAEVQRSGYALVTCADVVVALADHLWPKLVAPWRGACSLADLDRGLPVVLGSSAVLSLTAAALEMPDDSFETVKTAVPAWMSVRPVHRSPYPPHDFPAETAGPSEEELATITWWAARTEHWVRPMRTTRASRGQYCLGTALPSTSGGPPAVRVESLVSLDTLGRYWQASLSIERDDGRWWLTQPLSLEVRAHDLLGSAVGQVEPPRPALDRDPIDGESFGWAPGLLTTFTAGELGIRRQPA